MRQINVQPENHAWLELSNQDFKNQNIRELIHFFTGSCLEFCSAFFCIKKKIFLKNPKLISDGAKPSWEVHALREGESLGLGQQGGERKHGDMCSSLRIPFRRDSRTTTSTTTSTHQRTKMTLLVKLNCLVSWKLLYSNLLRTNNVLK